MIFLVCILVIIGLGLIFPKSKIVLALGFFLLFVVSTHFQAGYDMNNLQDTFENSNVNSEAEDRSLLFYSGLIYFNSIGFSFYQIRCFDFFIWGSAILLLMSRFSKYPTYVLSCCFLFPILSFASQMRNGLAAAFLYLAISSLFCSKNKRIGIVLYIILLIIAGLFHYLGFVYLIGLLALLPISNKKLIKYTLIGCIFIFFLYNGGIMYYLVSFFSPYYALNYFSGHGNINIINFIFLTIGIIINFKFTSYATNLINRHPNDYSNTYLYFSNFVSRLSLLSLIFLPLLLTNGSIYRIYQNLFILSAINISNSSIVYITQVGNQGPIYRFVFFSFFICVTAYYFQWQGEFMSFINSIKI